MIRFIKEFRQWQKERDEWMEWKWFTSIFEEIDIDVKDKKILTALSEHNETMDKVFHKTKNSLANKVISENLSTDFVKGGMCVLAFIKGTMKRK